MSAATRSIVKESNPTVVDRWISYTIFKDRFAKQKDDRADATWSDLAQLVRTASTYLQKHDCPLISLCEYGEKRTPKGSLRHAANVTRVYGIELDYDGEKVSIAAAAECLQAANLEAILYTSPSHKSATPRWRALLPLAEPATPDRRKEYVSRANRVLGGIISRESFTLSQSFYMGRVKDVEYEAVVTTGRCIDEAIELVPLLKESASGGGDAKSGGGRYQAMLKRSARDARRGVNAATIEDNLRDILGNDSANADGVDLTSRVKPLAESAVRKFGPAFTLDDFLAYREQGNYIFMPTGALWGAKGVNGELPEVKIGEDEEGNDVTIPASQWLDRSQAVQQITWAPGLPAIVEDCLVSDGGWIDHKGAQVFNLYRRPQIVLGDAHEATKWVEHVHRVYPNEADHIIQWLAHRAQRPQEKINHALVLGGSQGVGKDTLLEPIKHAIGPWNFTEVSPTHLLGRFNGFVKCVILRVSEARDLGEIDRFALYDHLKVYEAAPPDVLRCDEKNIREHSVFNVMGVVITSNHKTDGIYLPPDDRRHFVAWSELTRDDFTTDYWRELWRWYQDGGLGHVAAYFATLDISEFDAKAPPPKTPAWWAIVDANRSPEDAQMADAIDACGNPDALTTDMLASSSTDSSFADWLRDRRNARQLPYRLEEAGYVAVRNEAAPADGRWKIAGARKVVYARKTLSIADRQRSAAAIVNDRRASAGTVSDKRTSLEIGERATVALLGGRKRRRP